MLELATAEENQTPAVTQIPWDVVEVRALPEFRLHVRFNDGMSGLVDLSRSVSSPKAGMFAALADPTLFAKAGIDMGAVTWPGEIDLPPDAMHAEIREHGEWVL